MSGPDRENRYFGGWVGCLPAFIVALLLLPGACSWLRMPLHTGDMSEKYGSMLVWIAVGVVVCCVIWFIAESAKRRD